MCWNKGLEGGGREKKIKLKVESRVYLKRPLLEWKKVGVIGIEKTIRIQMQFERTKQW
jgi:hypothetical protein